MKRVKIVILFLIINIITFSIRLDDSNFDKIICSGESTEKEFIIENNSNSRIRYTFGIEGEEIDKNIEVFPKTIILSPNKKEKFTIKVVGEELGEKRYFLTIDEEKIDLSEGKNQLKVKMRYKIEQAYIVK